MKLIGVGGTNGSGKDTLSELLADDYGWLFVSGSDMLRAEARKRGLSVERENLRKIGAEWRREFGLGVGIDKAVAEYKKQGGDDKYHGLVVASLRNPGEADRVHELGGKVVWLDADPKLRYQRIYSRLRSAEDQKTFEQFQAEEYDEMHHHGGDAATLNMAGVKAKADVFITNDTDDIEQFKQTAKQALNL